MSYRKHSCYKPDQRVKKRVIRALKTFNNRVLFEYGLRIHTPVLIYQMGKVASKSVYRSLLSQYPGVVCHAHYFNSEHSNWRIRRLYRWVMNCNKQIDLISLTREPIGRNVSLFFQNFEKYTGVPYDKANYSLEELKEFFLTKFRTIRPGHWFDSNIKDNFGIDVYVNPFPECGYATYKHKNIRLLVMRLELNDNEKAKAIRYFLGLNEFQLVNSNISAQKEYALAYQDFKMKVKLPLYYVDTMCNSKYFKHFYDQDTIDSIKQKWCETK